MSKNPIQMDGKVVGNIEETEFGSIIVRDLEGNVAILPSTQYVQTWLVKTWKETNHVNYEILMKN